MRDFLTFVMIIVPVIILIVLSFIISREFSRIAEEKGHDGRRYFHFCFWLGLAGMLMVIALPDRAGHAAVPGSTATYSPVAVPTPPVRRSSGTSPNPWRCSCGSVNSASRGTCDSCGAPKPHRTLQEVQPSVPSIAPVSTPAQHAWDCVCGQSNTRSRHCIKCGAWLCTCDSINPAAKGSCDSCGAPKPKSAKRTSSTL